MSSQGISEARLAALGLPIKVDPTTIRYAAIGIVLPCCRREKGLDIFDYGLLDIAVERRSIEVAARASEALIPGAVVRTVDGGRMLLHRRGFDILEEALDWSRTGEERGASDHDVFVPGLPSHKLSSALSVGNLPDCSLFLDPHAVPVEPKRIFAHSRYER